MISVNDGKASFGTTTAESVKAAYEGSGDFLGKPQKRIRHVASFGFSLMFIYTNPDSPIQRVSQLKGKSIVYGGGTGSALLGRQILEVYGLSNDVRAERGDTEKARAALARKEIDAVFTIARLPVPAYTDMINKNALKLLPIEPDKIKALQKESPLYTEVDIRDFYPKYHTSTKAVGLSGPLVTRDDMSDGVVYQMLKIVYSRMEELQKMKSQFQTAVQDVVQSVRQEVDSATQALNQTWQDVSGDASSYDSSATLAPPPPEYRHPKKNWRLKRGSTPLWFKQKAGVKRHTQSGAARVARFRPPGRT